VCEKEKKMEKAFVNTTSLNSLHTANFLIFQNGNALFVVSTNFPGERHFIF